MHLPWGWVKQRPHFLAESLSQHFKVRLFFEKQYRFKDRLVAHESTGNLSFEELFKMPHFSDGFDRLVNAALVRRQLKRVIGDCDFLWLTHPNLIDRVREIVPGGCRIIYDCMDDILEFPYVKEHAGLRGFTQENERELMGMSDIIFASSGTLKEKLLERYGAGKEITVLNNGIHIEAQPELPGSLDGLLKSPGLKVVYVGAVSGWLDQDLLMESLNRSGKLRYLLFGPCETQLPRHERLVYCGPVEHRYVFSIMARADALVMPFKVSELVRSVNPVKLYEYVYSCRPAIAAEYGETLPFRDYVYLYRNSEEYMGLLTDLAENRLVPRKSSSELRAFGEENTWDKRIEVVVDLMRAVC